MCMRAHIGTQKKGGNIIILPRCVGTTPTHLYRPIGIDNDPIVHGIVCNFLGITKRSSLHST